MLMTGQDGADLSAFLHQRTNGGGVLYNMAELRRVVQSLMAKNNHLAAGGGKFVRKPSHFFLRYVGIIPRVVSTVGSHLGIEASVQDDKLDAFALKRIVAFLRYDTVVRRTRKELVRRKAVEVVIPRNVIARAIEPCEFLLYRFKMSNRDFPSARIIFEVTQLHRKINPAPIKEPDRLPDLPHRLAVESPSHKSMRIGIWRQVGIMQIGHDAESNCISIATTFTGEVTTSRNMYRCRRRDSTSQKSHSRNFHPVLAPFPTINS